MFRSKPLVGVEKKSIRRCISNHSMLKERLCKKRGRVGAYLKTELTEFAIQYNISLARENKSKKTVAELCDELSHVDISETKKTQKTKKLKTKAGDKKWEREYKAALGGDLSVFEEHQLRAAKFLTEEGHNGILLVHGTGSGKTRSSLAAALALSHQARQKGFEPEVVVVTQVSLLETFKTEMDKLGVEAKDRRHWTFLTYQGLSTNSVPARGGTVLEKVARYCRNDDTVKTILIIDEAHHIKQIPSELPLEQVLTSPKQQHRTGKQTKVALACANKAWKRILLTATPIMNRLDELSPLLAAIYGQAPRSKAMIAKMEEDDDMAELAKWVTEPHCAISFYKPSAAQQEADYPSMKEENLLLEMTDEEYDKYSELEEEIERRQEKARTLKHYAETGGKPKKRKKTEEKKDKEKGEEEVVKAGRDAGAFYSELRTELNNVKLTGAAAEWALNTILEKKQKTLFFSQFLESGVLAFADLLQENDVKYVIITGKSTKAERAAAVTAFNSDNDVQVFLISRAGAEGIDLKGVRIVILFDPSWTDETEKQIIARAVRYKSHAHLPKSQRNVTVYRIIVQKPPHAALTDDRPYSVDTYIYLVARAKEKKIKRWIKVLEENSIESNPDCV